MINALKRLRLRVLPLAALAVVITTMVGVPAYAQGAGDGSPVPGSCDTKYLLFPAPLGIPPWDQFIPTQTVPPGEPGPDHAYKDPGHACAIRKFRFPADIWLVVFGLVEIALKLAAYFAVGAIIYGGIRLITSQGNPEAIQGGRNTIVNAVIGLVIAMTSTVIVSFIARQFTELP